MVEYYLPQGHFTFQTGCCFLAVLILTLITFLELWYDALNPLANQMFTFKCSHLSKEKETSDQPGGGFWL